MRTYAFIDYNRIGQEDSAVYISRGAYLMSSAATEQFNSLLERSIDQNLTINQALEHIVDCDGGPLERVFDREVKEVFKALVKLNARVDFSEDFLVSESFVCKVS